MATPNDLWTAVMSSSIDLSSGGDTLKVLAIDNTSAYTFDKDNDQYVDDVLSGVSEMSGTGYSRQTLSSQSVTVDDANDRAVFDAADVQWTGLDAGTIQCVVIYQEVTTDADSRVIAVHDDASLATLPLVTNGSDVDITWPADGIAYIDNS